MGEAPTVAAPDLRTLLSGERRILELIATRAPLQQSLDAICRLIDELSGLRSSIFLLDRTGERLTFVAGPHIPDTWRAAVASLPITDTSCGLAVRQRRQVISPEIALDPLFVGYQAEARDAGIRAVWSTPFFSSYNQPLGTFAVASDMPGPPSSANLELVSRAAHLASIAVDRHANEQALKESEIRFSRAFYANPASMSICSLPDCRLTYVNDAFVRMFGYSRDEVLGQPATTFYVDGERRRAGILERLEKGAVHEVELQAIKKTGELCDLIVSLERIDVLGERSLLAIAVDITARKRAEEELRRADEQARKAIDAIPAQIWSGPPDGTVDFCNLQWRAYTGLDLADVQGSGWQRMHCAWQSSRHRQEIRCYVRDPDGHPIEVGQLVRRPGA